MSTIYTVRCTNCGGNNFVETYQGLVCRICGAINQYAPLPPNEMAQLAAQLASMNVRSSISPQYQQMVQQVLAQREAEEEKRRQQASLEELMGGMKVTTKYKRPKPRR